MLTEEFKDFVYFSKWFRADYPTLYKEITAILDANGMGHGLLSLTRDYWCRDYMPVQWGNELYAQFIYRPDYLRNDPKHLTDTDKVLHAMPRIGWVDKYPLVADGGNFVFCRKKTTNWNCYKYYIVMTDKIMLENPNYTQEEVEAILRKSLFAENAELVWLPWNHSDTFGHTDGILRYVGAKQLRRPNVLANLSLYEPDHAAQMRAILENHFKVIDLKLSGYDELSWAYINLLQTRDVIIIPGIGNPKTDREALCQIKKLYPQYGNRIYQVQMRPFIERGGGALNCCTWTISRELSGIVHNEENNSRYQELVRKAEKADYSLTKEEIFFLGDYYPLRLEAISPLLEKCYYGF